jgi:hypothetical protein
MPTWRGSESQQGPGCGAESDPRQAALEGMRLTVEERPDGVLLKPVTKRKVRTTKRAGKSN